MKVQSLQLKYFKRFRNPQIFDFTDPETGLANEIILLVGKNGAGKTSLLQAIASTLGVATGRLQNLSDLDWPGFNYELASKNWGQFAPEVELKIQFSKSEVQAISDFYQRLKVSGRDDRIKPSNKQIVSLKWHGGRLRARNSQSEFLQFKGREYAKQLLSTEGFQVFEQVGTIFWYTEQRTSTSLTSEDLQNKLEITYDKLRDRLSKWRQFHQSVEEGRITQLRPGQKDLYAEIENKFKTVFANRHFEGPVPREGIDDILSEPWFYLYDGKHQYEISEMSGGERAIFPMLMDFVNWNIHNSVILIDEIELHLHPPMQQALLRALPKLGKNNQFFITTHSDYVEQLIPNAQIIRLDEWEV